MEILDEQNIKQMQNFAKSREALGYLLKQFELAPNLINGRGDKEEEKYNDNFAGAYYNEEGYLVFCTVNIDTLNAKEYAGQVIHRKYKYSYNQLKAVKKAIAKVMKEIGVRP